MAELSSDFKITFQGFPALSAGSSAFYKTITIEFFSYKMVKYETHYADIVTIVVVSS